MFARDANPFLSYVILLVLCIIRKNSEENDRFPFPSSSEDTITVLIFIRTWIRQQSYLVEERKRKYAWYCSVLSISIHSNTYNTNNKNLIWDTIYAERQYVVNRLILTQPSTQSIVAWRTFELSYGINKWRKYNIHLWLLSDAEDKKWYIKINDVF